MDNVLFDIDKLKNLSVIDIEGGAKNFAGNHTYFNELDKFIKSSEHYLNTYNPAVVIFSDQMRQEFLGEVAELKNMLALLGIIIKDSIFNDLTEAVARENVNSLSDGLVKFHAEIEIITIQIAAALKDVTETEKPIVKSIILAVDDKPELLTTIVNMLDDKYTVMGATSGKAALKIVEKYTPTLFILDIEMPQMDGYELAQALRTHDRFEKTPIIFLTGKNSRESVLMAINQGVNEYVLKPVDKDTLLGKIKRHLG